MKLLDMIFHFLMAFLFVNASLPKPAWDCIDDKIAAKYYNETCSSDEDCFGTSMKCADGYCICNEDYVPAERFVGENAEQLVCVQAPSLFDECSTICRKPFVCKEHSQFNRKLCQCEPPFKVEDHSCYLECKENEDYDNLRFQCFPRCKANEVKINDACHALSQIGDSCLMDKQCSPTFSQCKDGKCSCHESFTAKEGRCLPNEIRCPNDKVVRDPKPCILKKNSDAAARSNNALSNNCPPDHVCQTFGGFLSSETSQGYCCPRAKLTCPVGEPHATAKCRDSADFIQGKTVECPWDSYYCTPALSLDDQLCCPRQCDASMVFVKGKCLPSAKLGSPCMENDQCTNVRNKCENGVCKCHSSKEIRMPTYSYCSLECPEGEILREDKCYAPLSLGDFCANETWRCPVNSICNKFNVCSCSCPHFTLTKDLCAPLPECPEPVRHSIYLQGSVGVSAMTEENETKYYQPIMGDKRRELLQSITFCAVTGRTPPKIEHVQQCPEDTYCARYLKELGVCCKNPEYICPNGRKPIARKKCHMENPLDCGLKHYCHNFLNTADPGSIDGNICCEREELNY